MCISLHVMMLWIFLRWWNWFEVKLVQFVKLCSQNFLWKVIKHMWSLKLNRWKVPHPLRQMFVESVGGQPGVRSLHCLLHVGKLDKNQTNLWPVLYIQHVWKPVARELLAGTGFQRWGWLSRWLNGFRFPENPSRSPRCELSSIWEVRRSQSFTGLNLLSRRLAGSPLHQHRECFYRFSRELRAVVGNEQKLLCVPEVVAFVSLRFTLEAERDLLPSCLFYLSHCPPVSVITRRLTTSGCLLFASSSLARPNIYTTATKLS